MSRQFDEAMEGRFDLYGKEYRLIEPENIEELMQALEVKSALEMLEEMFVVFATELGKKMD